MLKNIYKALTHNMSQKRVVQNNTADKSVQN